MDPGPAKPRPGWIIQESRIIKGKFYYFNPRTKASEWVYPTKKKSKIINDLNDKKDINNECGMNHCLQEVAKQPSGPTELIHQSCKEPSKEMESLTSVSEINKKKQSEDSSLMLINDTIDNNKHFVRSKLKMGQNKNGKKKSFIEKRMENVRKDHLKNNNLRKESIIEGVLSQSNEGDREEKSKSVQFSVLGVDGSERKVVFKEAVKDITSRQHSVSSCVAKARDKYYENMGSQEKRVNRFKDFGHVMNVKNTTEDKLERKVQCEEPVTDKSKPALSFTARRCAKAQKEFFNNLHLIDGAELNDRTIELEEKRLSLKRKACEEIEEERMQVDEDNSEDPNKRIRFGGGTVNVFSPNEPINVPYYVDVVAELEPVEDMDWESKVVDEISTWKSHQNNEKEVEPIKSFLNVVNVKRQPGNLYLVLDTNVLIGDLHFVQSVLDSNIEEHGPPVVFIPWQVQQELDGLKKHKDRRLSQSARAAVNYLYTSMLQQPRIQGQSLEEFEAMAEVGQGVPDDDILRACVQLQKRETGKPVILLTNDKNLAVKAHMCQMRAFSKDSFKAVLASDKKKKQVLGTAAVNLASKAKSIIRTLLISVMEEETELALGKDKSKPLPRSEWTLKGILRNFNDLWMSAYHLCFPPDLIMEVDLLTALWCKGAQETSENTKDALLTCKRLIACLKQSSDGKKYSDQVDRALTDIHSLILDHCSQHPQHPQQSKEQEATRRTTSASSTVVPMCSSRSRPAEAAFSRVKGMFLDALKMFQAFLNLVTKGDSPEHGFLIKQIPRLMEGARGVMEAAQAVLAQPPCLMTPQSNQVMTLAHALSKVKTLGDAPPSFFDSVAVFSTDPEGRQLLETSLSSLQIFLRELSPLSNSHSS